MRPYSRRVPEADRINPLVANARRDKLITTVRRECHDLGIPSQEVIYRHQHQASPEMLYRWIWYLADLYTDERAKEAPRR